MTVSESRRRWSREETYAVGVDPIALRGARVAQTDDARRVGRRLREHEPEVDAGRREHALAGAERQRIDVQVELVHEVVPEQRVNELAAPVGHDGLAGARLERAH